ESTYTLSEIARGLPPEEAAALLSELLDGPSGFATSLLMEGIAGVLPRLDSVQAERFGRNGARKVLGHLRQRDPSAGDVAALADVLAAFTRPLHAVEARRYWLEAIRYAGRNVGPELGPGTIFLLRLEPEAAAHTAADLQREAHNLLRREDDR